MLLQLAAGRENVMTSENTTLAGSLLTRPACLIYPEPGLEPTPIPSWPLLLSPMPHRAASLVRKRV